MKNSIIDRETVNKYLEDSKTFKYQSDYIATLTPEEIANFMTAAGKVHKLTGKSSKDRLEMLYEMDEWHTAKCTDSYDRHLNH